MNVLSLFDGMSCGQIALQRACIPYKKYYASEIDKYAIQISRKNYPETIQLGDVENWEKWDLPKIDLLLAGSPCTGFSNAGRRLNFNDPQSKLFFKFIDILKFYRPKYFLLENVKMKQVWKNIITEYVGVNPILINSALVSAQNRERLYWTNIPNIGQPEDRGIELKDIVEDSLLIDRKSLIHSQKAIDYMDRKTSDGRDHWDFKHFSDIRNTKSSAVVANFLKGVPYNVFKDWNAIRKFHPIECERLQTIPDNYTEGVSDTQRYKMIGNGWTVDVIAHILQGMVK